VLINKQQTKNQTFYFSNMKMLQSITSNQNIFQTIMKFFILFFIVIALSTPVKKETLIIDDTKGYEISLVVDISSGMRDDDKFKITKKIVKEFIEKRKYDRIALSVFADFAYVASPLTYDKKSLLNILEYIDIGIAGYRDTALYEALYLSGDIFKDSSAKNKIIILLTDGLNTINTVPLDVAIKKVETNRIKVYTVGVGKEISRNDDLSKIAKETNGNFYEALKAEELQKIYDDIDILEKSNIESKKHIYYEHFFQYPLVLALFLIFVLLLLQRRI
jgi:Ca-activated chloride channel family protein